MHFAIVLPYHPLTRFFGDPVLAKTIGPSETSPQRAAAEILALHRDHLRELSIEIVEAGVVIRGRAVSYCGKQIAFHEVRRRCGIAVVANEVEVQPAD